MEWDQELRLKLQQNGFEIWDPSWDTEGGGGRRQLKVKLKVWADEIYVELKKNKRGKIAGANVTLKSDSHQWKTKGSKSQDGTRVVGRNVIVI